MTGRHPHLLTALSRSTYPTSWIVVDCDSTLSADVDHPGAARETLTGWVGTYTRRRGTEYPPDAWCDGADVASFWARVDIALARGGTTWLFAERVTRVLSLLQTWEEIDHGRVSIGGTDCRDRGRHENGAVPGLRAGAHAGHDNRPRIVSDGVRQLLGGVEYRAGNNGRGIPPTGRQWQGVIVLEDPPVIIQLRRLSLPGTLHVVDVANYGAALSPSIYRAIDRARRVGSFVRSMIHLLRTEKLGSLRSTSASQSMTAYRTTHLTTPVVCHADERVLNLEGDSYYGGRCECLRVGALPGPVFHLDVSAMYTSICAQSELPAVLCGYSERPTDYGLSTLRAHYQVFADVGISTADNDYPYKHPRLKLTIWPIGTFRTVLAGPELWDAYDRGCVKRWYRIAWYQPHPMLQSYAWHILRLRELYGYDRDVMAWIKSLGVSIVGKLGQHSRYWTDDDWDAYHEVWDQWWDMQDDAEAVRWRSVAGHTQRETVGDWSYDAVPAVASWVTSLGRLQLLQLLRVAGADQVHYVDTDALMVTCAGYNRLCAAGLVAESTPGMLRLKTVSQRVEMRGIKHYVEDGVQVCAGMPAAQSDGAVLPEGYVITPRLKSAMRARTAPVARQVLVPFEPRGRYLHGISRKNGEVWPHSLAEEL